MIEKNIKITGIEDAKKLVTLTMDCEFPVEITGDDMVIDAKSIMGIFSLDFNKAIVIKFYCDSESDIPNDFKEFYI